MNKRTLFRDIIFVILGNFILACGVVFFILPNSILSGGIAGIAVAIEPVFKVDPNILIMTFTIVLFIIGGIFLGKSFTLKTALSSFIYPGFTALLSQFSKSVHITSDPMLASIYGGALMGIGIGLVFRSGASTGGMDIPPLIIHKYTHIPVPTLVLITDGLTVMLGLALHGIEPALIGIISVWTCAYMVNKTMMLGLLDAKSLMIISDEYEAIVAELTEKLDRGATLLTGKGAYTREDKPVVMTVISKKQFPRLMRSIQAIDPGAFVVVGEVNEVHGEGFTFEGE